MRLGNQTDFLGIARFGGRREWQVDSLMVLHGRKFYFWNWCVRKEGYATFATGNKSGDEFVANPIITLRDGRSRPCPIDMRVIETDASMP